MCTSHRLRLAAVLSLLSFACAQSARTQRGITEPREIEAPFAPSSQRPARGPSETLDPGLGLIKLDLVVTDTSGTPIPGIPSTDFTVLDNGEPSSIFSFQAFDGVSAKPDPAVEVILVIDTLQVPGDLIRYERHSVETFLRRNGGHLAAPVSVLTLLDSGLWQVGQTSSDGNALASLVAHDRGLALIHPLPGGLKASPSRDALKALGAIATGERQRRVESCCFGSDPAGVREAVPTVKAWDPMRTFSIPFGGSTPCCGRLGLLSTAFRLIPSLRLGSRAGCRSAATKVSARS
jgi:hypothetical protein